MTNPSSDLNERIDRFSRGDLSAPEARRLAQEALDEPDVFDELTSVALVSAALKSLQSSSEERLARYMSGRLPSSEERALARQSLDHEDVFDALAAHGAVEQSLLTGSLRPNASPAGARVIRFSRATRALAIGSIAAAALLAITVLRQPETAPPPASAKIAVAPPSPSLRPALGASADPGQPILLAAGLDPLRPSAHPVFRSVSPEARPPRLSGVILALDRDTATISLGSVDGVTKGSELRVFRAGAPSQPISRITITTVFRDRSRGRIDASGAVQEGDQVRLDSSVHFNALVQQVESLRDRGKLSDARDTAQRALAWAESEALARGERRKMYELLAAFKYQTGATAEALKYLQAAADNLSAPPAATAAEQTVIQNGLGALYMVLGDYPKADRALSPEVNDNIDVLQKAQALNNLGVLSELRGDSSRAEADYRKALETLDSSAIAYRPERHAIESNLARVKRPN